MTGIDPAALTSDEAVATAALEAVCDPHRFVGIEDGAEFMRSQEITALAVRRAVASALAGQGTGTGDAGSLVGETRSPKLSKDREREIALAPEAIVALRDLLFEPWMRGVGYSEFILRAVAAARAASSGSATTDPLTEGVGLLKRALRAIDSPVEVKRLDQARARARLALDAFEHLTAPATTDTQEGAP